MRSLITRALCGTLAGIIVVRLIVTWHVRTHRRMSQTWIDRIAWLLSQPAIGGETMTIERETALAYAAREWEGEVCDLVDASDVAAALIDETLSQTSPGVDLSAGEVRRILFVTYQTHRMVSAFRDRYYEAIEANG